MSKCIYCGSSAYGKSCLYSPTGNHMHMDESDKCIYCASKNSGQGCPYNPYGTLHVKGFAIYNNVKEQITKTAILAVLLEKLENTDNRNKQYKSKLDRLYKRASKNFTESMTPFLDAYSIQSEKVVLSEKLSDDKIVESIDISNRLSDQLEDLFSTLKHANCALPPEIVENILADAIVKVSDKY